MLIGLTIILLSLDSTRIPKMLKSNKKRTKKKHTRKKKQKDNSSNISKTEHFSADYKTPELHTKETNCTPQYQSTIAQTRIKAKHETITSSQDEPKQEEEHIPLIPSTAKEYASENEKFVKTNFNG